jgi:hypothetical protein
MSTQSATEASSPTGVLDILSVMPAARVKVHLATGTAETGFVQRANTQGLVLRADRARLLLIPVSAISIVELLVPGDVA